MNAQAVVVALTPGQVFFTGIMAGVLVGLCIAGIIYICKREV
ncbi:MAG: hypothetical protein VW577_05060 [Pelagibacteraceae bacterium]